MADYYGIDYIIKRRKLFAEELKRKREDLEQTINHLEIEIRSLERIQNREKKDLLVECECYRDEMELIEEDRRSEWYEQTYRCKCGHSYIRRQEYDQNGLVTSDTFTKQIKTTK